MTLPRWRPARSLWVLALASALVPAALAQEAPPEGSSGVNVVAPAGEPQPAAAPADPDLAVGASTPVAYSATAAPPAITLPLQLNSIQTEGIRKPVTTDAAATALTRALLPLGLTYADALGRVVQTVSVAASPTSRDVVTPVVFNAIGMTDESRPAFVCNTTAGCTSGKGYYPDAVARQEQFYAGSSWATNSIAPNTEPHAVTVREKAPTLRVVEQGGLGPGYQPGSGHTVRTLTRTNTATEVRRWTANLGPSGGGLASSGFYGVGTLYVQETTDPNGVASRTFTDQAGREVLREATAVIYMGVPTVLARTYSVYDEAGNLRYVIPPEGSKLLPYTSTVVVPTATVTDIVSKWATEYRRDGEGREVERIKPEEGPVTTVYDRLGRVVLRQDGVFRPLGKWLFTKYDDQGRAVMTGVYTETVAARKSDRAAMQAHVDGLTTFSETRTADHGHPYHGYTNTAFPVLSADAVADEVWSVSYHDDYSFITQTGLGWMNFLPRFATPPPSTGGLTADPFEPFFRVRGSVTAVKELIFEPVNPSQRIYLWSISYYDKKGRTIQTVANVVLGREVTSTLYAFSGEPLLTRVDNYNDRNGYAVTVEERPTYTSHGRPLASNIKVDQDPEVRATELWYNELGAVSERRLHYGGAPKYRFWQYVDYRYDAQGRLTNMNGVRNTWGYPDWGGSDPSGDVFAHMIFYDTFNAADKAALGLVPRYDGSIAGTLTFIDEPTGATSVKWDHGYGYTYDALGRMTAARYNRDSYTYTLATGAETTGWEATGRYNETVTYDLNGNIKSLRRNGRAGTIDNLSYVYDANRPNQLVDVDESATVTDGLDFRSTANQVAEYLYDGNGNLTRDLNKGLTVGYTYHNLPWRATFDGGGEIDWVWSASGARLVKRVRGPQAEETVYSGSVVYRWDGSSYARDYVSTDWGRVVWEGGAWTHEHHLTDHLGNVRMALSGPATGDARTIRQRRVYYPHGLAAVGASQAADSGPEQPFTFNGKELDEEYGLGWHHYGVRFYDPQLGRWPTMDPVDEFPSPYVYVGGDPVNFVDPNGAQSASAGTGSGTQAAPHTQGQGPLSPRAPQSTQGRRVSLEEFGNFLGRMGTVGDAVGRAASSAEARVPVLGPNVVPSGTTRDLIMAPVVPRTISSILKPLGLLGDGIQAYSIADDAYHGNYRGAAQGGANMMLESMSASLGVAACSRGGAVLSGACGIAFSVILPPVVVFAAQSDFMNDDLKWRRQQIELGRPVGPAGSVADM